MREEFRKPFGKITCIKNIKISAGKKFITVGDAVSFSSIQNGMKPDVIVFDNIEKRKPVNVEVKKCLQNYAGKKIVVKNPAGCITEELWNAVKIVLQANSSVAIEVEGEEDLTAFPFFLEADIGTVVVYGLLGKGVVEVKVDKKLKDKCTELLKEMKQGL